MNRFILYLFPVFMKMGTVAFGQSYLTRTGQVIFEASTPLETVHAVQNQVAGILDLSSGEVVFEVLIKGFRFEKALMQEHFNENYMESDRFPKAVFKGKLTKKQIALLKGGTRDMEVTGTLTIHGISKTLKVPVNMNYKQGLLVVQSVFVVRPEDFQIKIPSLVRNKIAETVEVKLRANMKAR